MVRLLHLGTAAALVFTKIFFPSFEPLVGTLLAFATYAVGFVARPLGGVVFGHYGDKLGRKNVLVFTLLLMGVSTFLVGVMPTYGTIGVWAPILLVALRFLQGLGLGGEWGGAVLIAATFQIVLIPGFGVLSDRFGRRPVYLFGAIGAAVWIFVFFALLDTGSFILIVLATVVALVFHAAMYGPQASFIAEMFPTQVRYTGASMGYQLAGILGGAVAPLISVALLDQYDTSLVVSLYVVAMLVITALCVIAAPETSRVDLHADPAEAVARR